MKIIKKAILPVAGFGTRFLPATKAIPKEMLPIIDKPLIEYAVEEAVDAGIEEIIFITSHTKIAIENHFDTNFELEEKLNENNKHEYIELINPKKPSKKRASIVVSFQDLLAFQSALILFLDYENFRIGETILNKLNIVYPIIK